MIEYRVESQYFGYDKEKADKHEATITLQVFGIVGGVVAVLVALALGATIEETYDLDERKMFDFIRTICWIFAAGELIFSPFIIYEQNQKLDRLKRSYIRIYSDRIEGVSFVGDAGRSFSVDLKDVVSAEFASDNQIVIHCKTNSFGCYDIENKYEAINAINDAVRNYKIKAEQEAQTVQAEKALDFPDGFRFCMFCGTKLPAEAVFCAECGKKQTEA